ncbi:carbohydrate sulfotransferase 8-like isoform X2 [Tigriopus californicus]|uniref:carbohydrate sulfotransferase 8-like isoform X2 n=1 Tax=Tigriopus californicus TaxID=6832 RepID=UPI0027DA909E|nr:carbohydrate sulfotransferase 8-like isoform X2 [Tigriopus californicus]
MKLSLRGILLFVLLIFFINYYIGHLRMEQSSHLLKFASSFIPSYYTQRGAQSGTTNSTDLAKFMRSREILYEKRRKRVNDVCLKYGQDLHRRDDQIAGSFMVSEENLIVYCRMGKVGSSTWMQYFLNMDKSDDLKAQIKDGASPHSCISRHFRLYPREIIHEYNAYLLVVFVRHPFERLASAFEDKINSTRDEQFTSWRKKFTKTYADCKVNHHWQPFYDQCGFCNVSFDVIGTLDEFQSDMIYIQERLHRPNIFNLTIRANSALQTSQESTIREKTLEYFKELKKEQIRLLLHHYQIDFELFGYESDEYQIDMQL